MSFPYTPYETVAFTAEKLSFSGFRGMLLSELWQVIQHWFKQEQELDDFQKDTIWKWLFFDYIDEHGREEVKFYVTYDKDPITIESSYPSFIAKQEKPEELRVLPTEETQCYYLTGVSNNKKFIFTLGVFPYQLLQEIARNGSKGTWASDLPSTTGQDKRSMTARLSKLEEAGLIVKEHRFYEEKRIHSTWAVHYKFGDASKASKGDEEEQGFDHTPVKMRKFIMNSLKQAQNNVRTFRDMKVELKMNRNVAASRLFGSVILNLCEHGYIEKIDVEDQVYPGRKHYALRLVKDLPSQEAEFDLWDLSVMNGESNENSDDDDEDNDEEYTTASFNDLFPFTAQVYETIRNSGSQGLTSRDIVTSISGDVKHRQIIRLLEKNTDYLSKDGGLEPLLSYPPEHKTTAIVKQSESDGRLKFYRYYSIDNFRAKLSKSHKKKRPERKLLDKPLSTLEKKFYVKLEKVMSGPLLGIPDFVRQGGNLDAEREISEPNDDNTVKVKTTSRKRDKKDADEIVEPPPKRRRLRTRGKNKVSESTSLDSADHDISMHDDEDQESDYTPEDEKSEKSDDVEAKSNVKVKIEKPSRDDKQVEDGDNESKSEDHKPEQSSNIGSSNRVFTPQITQRQKNTRVKKEQEKSQIDEADVRGAFRRDQFIQLIIELGGATFTSAKLGRMLDQRIKSDKPTDIKTIARDLNKLAQTGVIEVQVIPLIQSGRTVNRRLIIINDPKHRPSDEFIDKIKSKSKEPTSNTSERAPIPRRFVETEYTLVNTRDALKRRTSRLTSLNSESKNKRSRGRAQRGELELDNVLDLGTNFSAVSEYPGKFEDQLATFELDTTTSRPPAGKKSKAKRKRYPRERKGRKVKTEFDISDITSLFRAICICKAFNKSYIDYDSVSSLFKDTDARSLKRTWVHVRKSVGGLDAVNKGVEEFERVVMKGIDEQYILVEDLETIDLAFYLELWANFDTSKIEVQDKFPLYRTLEDNLFNYTKKQTFEIQPDLFDLIDSDSMKQKEEALANTPFFYSVPQELVSHPLDKVKATVKSVYRHPNKKHSKPIKEILSRFNPTDVESALAEMENEKEIVRVDEETSQFKLTEKVYAGLTSKCSVSFFKQADLFKENAKEVMKSQRGMILSQGIEDGSVAELLCLVSLNGISLGHIDSDYVFEGYESRSMDKDALKCDLVVFKGPTNDPITQSVTKVRVPVSEPCSYAWVDIDGHIEGKLWTHIIVSLLYIIHYRPGIPAAHLYGKVHNLLTVDEFDVIMRWLIDSKCIEMGDYLGVTTTCNWLSLFGHPNSKSSSINSMGGATGRGRGRGRGGAGGRGRGGFSQGDSRGGGAGRGGRGGAAGHSLYKISDVNVNFEQKASNEDALKALQKYKSEHSSEIESDAYKIALRHDYGSAGVKTEIGTNYFQYQVAGLKLYVYFVDVQEEGDKKDTKDKKFGKRPTLKVKDAVSNYLFNIEPFKSKRPQIYYRDFHMLYSKVPLPVEDVAIYPVPEKSVSIKVQFVKELKFDDLIKYSTLQKYTKDFQEVTEYTNALISVIGSKVLENKSVVGLGSNKFFFFDKSTPVEDFQQGLFITLGTFVSVRSSFNSIRLNLNPTPAIFYKAFKSDGQPMSVIDLVKDYLGLSQTPTESDLRRVQPFLKGVKIYRNYLKKISGKAVQGLNFKDNAKTLEFEESEGKVVSVASYFETRWGIKLKHPTLPLLKIGPSAYLPMEVAFIVPHQQFTGEVWDTRTIIRLTAMRPMDKAKLIAQQKSLTFNDVDFGTVDSKFTRVPARVLTAPGIEYKNKKITFKEETFNGKTEKTKGNWNLESAQFVEAPKTKSIYTFGVFILKNQFLARKKDDLAEACSILFKELNRLGIKNVGDKFRKYSVDLDSESVRDEESLERSIVGLFQIAKLKDKCDYMIAVLPSKDTKYYRAVKRAADLKAGLNNSCVILDTFTKKKFDKFDMTLFAQLAMKINLKLGGSNHRLSVANSVGLFDNKKVPVFILGADVTHPTGQMSKDSVSVAAVVGSEDGIFNKFPGSLRVQAGGREMIADIKSMVYERLENFHKKVKALPSKVLFYRDGVSEGQYYTSLKEELPKVKAAFVQYGKQHNMPTYNPKITFMIVVKRHHTRFIPLEQNATDPVTKKKIAVTSNDNVIPGTTIDRGITSISFFDFYIQSQQALQGTGIPAHYYVLHDENNYSSDDIQRITYNLCHTFGRATKSVKVVPAAYYADLLCTRGRYYVGSGMKDGGPTGLSLLDEFKKRLGDNVASGIRNTMFYI
ncbi:TFC3 [Candida metapsilosis]|uniref:TFC3 n=1 Tax=Candida metapsilosis TaxID=273372 RepID=A0A8H8DB38_9ASCO|nr:TFC3 [Candida metapsilosis]